MKIKDVEAIINTHHNYYNVQRLYELDALTRCYERRLLKTIGDWSRGRPTIEPAIAKQYIDSYMASLFPKAPAVVVEHSGKAEGDAKLVESVCNRFLYDKAPVIEQAMRTAFIYPFSFLKLGLLEAESVLDMIEMRPIKPWDCIVDFEAETFEQSRYVGHRLWVPMLEAKKRYPGKQFSGCAKHELFDQTETDYQQGVVEEISDYMSYIEVYEIYDLLGDECITYSPQAKKNDGIIKRIKPIPFRDHANRPMSPMVPVYFDYDIVQRLRGASHLHRIFDQVLERANLRTEIANNVRRDSRQYITAKGLLGEEAKAQLSEAQDGAVIEVELSAVVGRSLSEVFVPLPQVPFSQNLSYYDALIERDLQAGSLLGAFTKGQATNVSATEIAALTQYTSTEIGKLARIRDEAIEYLCRVYVSIIAFLLETGDENVREIHTLDGNVQVIRAQDFIGRFRFAAADQANTPISSALRKQELMSLIPILMEAGTPAEAVLDQLIRLYDLPASFKPEKVEVAPEAAPVPQSAVTGPPPGAEIPLDVGGGPVAPMIRQMSGL